MIAPMQPAGHGIARRDVTIAAVLSVLGLVLMYANVKGLTEATPEGTSAIALDGVVPNGLTIALFLLVTVPLAWRRVAPVAALGVVAGGWLTHVVAAGTDVVRCGVVLPVVFLLVFSAAVSLGLRAGLGGLGLGLALVAGESVVFFGWSGLGIAAVTGVVWGIGRVMRSRARMADELKLRTAELREVRDERARLEVAAERARVSGELDALLQRRLGELVRMADEGASASDGATATATLVGIERESRRTLNEMRALVGLLRDDSSEAPTSPQPTLTHLEALLVRAKGGQARLTVAGSPRVLPAAVELSAYRIVEHLLAALEDAPDVEVRVGFRDDALELAVSGPARRDAKASIERARERARLQRGTVEATVRAGRAEAVAALPVAVVG